MSCLYSFRTKDKLQSHKKVGENKDFCNIVMSSEDTKLSELIQYKKFNKTPFVIYAYLECLIEKIIECKSKHENSSTTKEAEHTPLRFSVSRKSPVKDIKRKHEVYIGKDCMKTFYKSLRDHAMKIIDFKKKKEVINKRTEEII